MAERCQCCQPTVDHVAEFRASVARCYVCGACAAPIHWETPMPPRDAYTRAINNFRSEYHHAD